MENASTNNGFTTSEGTLMIGEGNQKNRNENAFSTEIYEKSQMQRSDHFMEKKQEKVINNSVGAFNDLDDPSDSKEQDVKEDQMMCFELPTGKKGFIGEIRFSFGGSTFDETEGVSEWTATPILVENVTRGSIAEKAGLEPYDEIIKINGITVACAARSLPVSLIKQCDKKMRILVRKGKGRKRTENIVFSNEQITEFYDAFSIYDRLNKRKILVKDVPRLLRTLGYNETSLAIDDAITTARLYTGELEEKKIRWDTFLEIMKQILKHQDVNKEALSAYAVFDPERKGYFDISQLRDAFMISCRASTLELADILRIADPNFDGEVNEKEFLQLLYPFVEMY